MAPLPFPLLGPVLQAMIEGKGVGLPIWESVTRLLEGFGRLRSVWDRGGCFTLPNGCKALRITAFGL